MTSAIHSEHLDLVPLLPEFLRAFLDHDLTAAAQILGAPLPDGLLDSTDVMATRLQQLEADPALQPWLLRAIVLRDRREMIGHIGFHTAPGAENPLPYSPGAVEFGFTVYPPFRRLGYAREASLAMMHWAHQAHGITNFVLTISPENAASQALAVGLGFVRIGSHIDEIDGLEDILEYRLPAATGNNCSNAS